MKRAAAGTLALLGAAFVADAGHVEVTPMERVAGLMEQMKTRIEADGKLEQESYDKYACWCEDTMGRKAGDISKCKETIEQESSMIIKLKAEIASHQAEIQQSKKDIEANIEAQRDATAVRDKDHAEYVGEKTESEQCSGALEAAINVLSGAGEKKKAFLEQTLREAELLSVVAGVRSVISKPAASRSASQQDLDAVRTFIEHPDDFLGRRTTGDFMQLRNNPFGDYAPQSTQIQGILKGMYDTFVGDLEKNNAEEAEAQKSFEELMATKKRELEALQETLEQHELDEAGKTKQLAESNQVRDDTEAQLEADEKLFQEVKTGCQTKASEWSLRTKLRTQELAGVGKAIEILTSPEARKTFQNATTTFVEVSSTVVRKAGAKAAEQAAHIADLARKHHSTGLAQLATVLKTGGHFDKVMAAIDAMVQVLRKEEQEDIAHRDRCQNAEGKNTNDMEDLNHAIDKAEKSITRLNADATQLRTEVAALKSDIESTKTDMTNALGLRNDDVKAFRQAVKDDTDAIALLEKAVDALKSFFKKNKIGLSLAKVGQEPEYTTDPDKAPETTWSDSKYGGRKSETQGIVAIVEMIKEDLQKEIKTARQDDAEAQAQYEKERAGMQETLDAQMALKIAKEGELNDVEAKISDTEDFKTSKSNDLGAESSLKDSIYSDCSRVKTHFDSRREKRKTEMDGLAEAKSYLSGVESGDEM